MQPRSARLNSENRDKFIRTVLKDKLPENKNPGMDAFRNRWRDKIYEIAYGKYEKKMKELPSFFFDESDTVCVRLITDNNASIVSFKLPVKKRVVRTSEYGRRHNSQIPIIDQDHEIVRDFKQTQQNEKDFKIKERELRDTLHKLVYSCNTSGQVYKAWPEAIKYADCFPYIAPNRHSGAKVSHTEMDISVKMADALVKITQDE